MKHVRWALCAVLAAACGKGDAPAAGGASGNASTGGRPQRVVLITLDTLRLDAFDGPRSMMPEVDAWARRGKVFTNYYTVTSTTQPTHATLFTGLYPWEHGLTANAMVFSRKLRTVAEILSDNGFETSAVVASFPLHGVFGFDQGFGSYSNEFGAKGEIVSGDVDVDRDGDLHSEAGRIRRRALEVLDEVGDGNQFLWFHFFDPHAPYGDSLGDVEKSASPWSVHFPRRIFRRLKRGYDLNQTLTRVRELYDADVHFLDSVLGQLFERLDEDSDRFETHVVVVSDHGEALGEDGSIGHGKRMLECLVHVPLVVVSPRMAPGRSDVPVGTVDVAETLLVLAGVAEHLPHGEDLTAPVDPDRSVFGMRRTFAEPYEEHRTDGRDYLLPEHLYYQFGKDGYFTGDAEQVRAGSSSTVLPESSGVTSIRERFQQFQQSLDGLEIEPIQDPELLRHLEALGYTQ